MSEKDEAIRWDEVTRSGTDDDLKLRIDVIIEDLRSAPEYERRD